MRRQDWASGMVVVAVVLALVAIVGGSFAWAGAWVVVALGAGWAAHRWSRLNPGPMPYALRWVLRLPRGPHSPRHLDQILEPQRGERMLEIGPGIGIHALAVASALAPDGTLDVLDAQQAMLDELMRRGSKAGVMNVVPKRGDAQRLPYPDGAFDAAYLIGVLGEIPDPQAALRELRRVLRPGGRLLIGEVVADPDFVSLGSLRVQAQRAGFAFERKLGPALSYLARFRPA